MKRFAQLLTICVAVTAVVAAVDLRAQDAKAGSAVQGADAMAARYANFQKLLTGSKLIGQFTVDGRPMDKLSSEEYEISKVEKTPEGDVWIITARIKYGGKDVSIPVPLEVKWAGSTPVLTMDNMALPGLGTFSARILFHRDRYAGTWQHDDKGGHMFGKIELASGGEPKK